MDFKSLRIFAYLVVMGLSACAIMHPERAERAAGTMPRTAEFGTAELGVEVQHLTRTGFQAVESTDASKPSPADDSKAQRESGPRQLLEGALVRIPLPIVGEVDTEVKRQIDRAVERMPVVAETSRRPVLVLEFDLASGATGEGTDYERASSLARYLTSSKFNMIRTVAYLPASQARFTDIGDLDAKQITELRGHAVLVALSCEQIVMEPDTAIGAAGIDEGNSVDESLSTGYRVRSRRGSFPEPLVMSLLDKRQTLFRVTTDKGFVYADAQKLAQLEAGGEAIDTETITDAESFPTLTSERLLEYRLIDFRVTSRQDLADRLGIRAEVLLGDPSLDGEWNALHVKFAGPIEKREVDWVLSALAQKVSLTDVNLIVVEIESRGGDANQCLRMARKLAEFNPLEVRTVAFVPREALGATSLIALACDHLIMAPDAKLGGPADGSPTRPGPDRPENVDNTELLISIKRLSQETERSWSLMGALVDPSIQISRMQNRKTGKIELLSDEELREKEDVDQWVKQRPVETASGIEGRIAEEIGLTRQLAERFEEVKTFYQLAEDPELLQPTLTDKWIQRMGKYLSSPMIAGWLLFGTMFFFMVEMSNPGIGFPGFIATIFCMLFFWSQYCDGNANWLEILMFAVGLIFICVEIFVVPGVGIFGIGGAIMVLVSIVLATQDFLWPRTTEQLKQLPVSLSMILFAGAGMIASAVVIRTFLPHIPYLNKLILDPPGSDDELESLSSREALNHLEYLVGKRGVAVTPLLPSGKAQIGEEVHNVITDGRVIEKGESIVVRKVDGNRVEVAQGN